MPEQPKLARSKFQGEKDFKPKYAKLGAKITDVVKHKLKGVTADDPEYWGLREMLTEEMVDILLKMKQRAFYSFEDLVKANPELEPAHLQEVLNEMAVIGILEYDYGDNYDHTHELVDKPRVKRWRLSYFVPGSAELFNSSEDRIARNPAVANFFERMTFIPLAGLTEMVPPGGDGIGMHVIPVEKAIEHESTSVDLEHISYWLDKYENHISAGICSCRGSRKVTGDGCADDVNDWCIQLGDMADYTVETGRAHYITKEKALEICRQAEKNGYVHQITNIDGTEKIFDICNCNVEICNALRTSLLFNTPNLSRSAYTAKTDPAKCVACGYCVEVCPAGAVKLGQKLCHKDGKPFTYPQAVLPDAIKWGRYAWDENYRDTARKTNTYATGTSPCKQACPAHVPVQAYLKKAHDGKYREALALIKKENPFPAVCGRVCNKRCEEACTRGEIDKAVSIDAVKKFVADFDLKAETRYVPEKVVSKVDGEWDEKIAIIGAGPAGLSAAYYLAEMGYRPTVFEKNERPGGMLMYGIPTYKLEKDVIEAEIEVMKELGVEIRCGVEVGKDVTIAELKEQGYKAFYIAIGCQGGRRPGVANDTAEGTEIAVEYLKKSFENQEKKFTGKVVVIGGGNVAVDCARTASRLGSEKVTMVALETRDTMPASNEEIAETLEEDIVIENSWGPKQILVDENGRVKGVVLKRCTRTIDPETKRFSPLYDEEETMTLEADKIVFAIGQAIEWGKLLEGTGVTLRNNGAPIADKLTYQTADPDIYVGGDVLTGPRFVIDAIAAGHAVAEDLHRHVRPGAHPTIALPRRHFMPLDKSDISFPSYDTAGRQEEGMDESIDYKHSFRDAHKTFTEEQVRIETGRCLSCGASVVDPNKCIGCGLCTTRCEFDAIHLVRDHPKCTTMVAAEKKYLPLLRYVIKRQFKILFHSGSKEARMMRKKRKEFNKRTKKGGDLEFKPWTGNAVETDA